MRKFTFLIIIIFTGLNLFGQDAPEAPKYGISFSGFVKNDFSYDSRQTIAAREGHFLLFPKSESLDKEGNDINGKSNLNFLSIQSRLSGKITGPDAFGAKTSGLIEVDFFAQADDNINLVRMRHAFIKLNWERAELLLGQYWNPFFVTGCFPGVVSFNTGAPIQPFARNPQIRFTYKLGALSLMAVAQTQRDYTSRGPDPANPAVTKVSSDFLRNSAIPDLHFQIHLNKKFGNNALLLGVGWAYKELLPVLKTDSNYVNEEKVKGLSFVGFANLKTKPITIKFEGIYGRNICDVLSIGGFAVVENTNAEKSILTYSPTNTMSVWTDIHTNGTKMQFGVFAGLTKNMGTNETLISGPIYGLGTNIDQLYRVAPRIILNAGKVRFALELEYTAAGYGTNDLKDHGRVIDPVEVSNMRVLFGSYYFF
ncbi:MAG: hypothetical protein K9H64_19390 [Bacteroidales bacterium]|nr:hypothetical protein [Bacteroidales bacterium]MCF8458244.1 hypothetical protein [Bacteroidales bacterium]